MSKSGKNSSNNKKGKANKVPYEVVGDLPAGITNNLPLKAQQLYLNAYSEAWAAISDAIDEQTRHTTSHVTAWAKVKTKYHLNKNGDWVER